MKLNLLFGVIITGFGCILFLFIFENLSSTGSISFHYINKTQNKINYVTEYNLNGDILEFTVVDKSKTPFVWRKSGVDTIGLIKIRTYQGKIGIWKPDNTNKKIICTDTSFLNKVYEKFKIDKLLINDKLSKTIVNNQQAINERSRVSNRSNRHNGVNPSYYIAPSIKKREPNKKLINSQTPNKNQKPSTGTTTKNADDL